MNPEFTTGDSLRIRVSRHIKMLKQNVIGLIKTGTMIDWLLK